VDLKTIIKKLPDANLNLARNFCLKLSNLNIVLIRVYPRKSAVNLLTP